MKTLLVWPKNPSTFWSFDYIIDRYTSKKAAFPPLGLLTIAAMLPSDWKLRLVDLNVNNLTDEDLQWADMVFISAMIVQKQSVEEIIKRCHQFDKPIVAGGPYFTTGYKDISGVDYFVLDEAELTLPAFLRDLEQGTAKSIYRDSRRPELTNTPIPKWSLVDPKDYVTGLVQFSRGCPYDCEFCDIIVMNGRKPRLKKPDQLIAELDSLYQHGWRDSIFIVDDNFIGNKKEVMLLLRRLIEWQKSKNYPYRFFTETSVNLAQNDELLELMKNANFNKVFIGIETPHDASLQGCHKTQNLKMDLVVAVKKIQQFGMQVMGGFIVGFDEDPIDIFKHQIEFIQKTGIVNAMVGILIALPQTKLWYRLKNEKRLLSDTGGENTSAMTNIKSKMGNERLVAGYKKVLISIYSPKQYYKRIRTFIKEYQPVTYNRKVKFQDIKSLLKSWWYIGIFSKTNWRYWWLFYYTAFTKIKALPTVVELVIQGQHFYRLARKIAIN